MVWTSLELKLYCDTNKHQRLGRNQSGGPQIPDVQTKSNDLIKIDGLISAAISAFSKEVRAPDLSPADVMDCYRTWDPPNVSTPILRSTNIENPNPFGREGAFRRIAEPCTGIFERDVDPSRKKASVLGSDQMLIAWLRNRDDNNNICWISGDPGTGKSVLMKHIVSQSRSDPSLLTRGTKGAASNNTPEQNTSCIIWHVFSRAGDPVSVQREELTMIQNILLQLYRQFPEEIERGFAKAYNTVLRHRKPDYIKAGLSTFRFKVLEHSLFSFLADGSLIRPPIFIFLDGPSGFTRRKTAFLGLSEAEDCPLIYRLRGLKGVKVCIASRPGGMFHDWNRPLHGREQYKFCTLAIERYTRGDIETFCINCLDRVPIPVRLPLAERIANASENSFILARDKCEAAARAYVQRDDIPVIANSQVLFDSLVDEISALPTYFKLGNYLFGPQNRLDVLSEYLNLIVTHTKYNLSRARNGRPLSLLQLTLATDSYRKVMPTGALTEYQLEFLARACDTIAHKIQRELYPLIVLREMETHEKPSQKLFHVVGENLRPGYANVRKRLALAAATKVTLLHSNMLQYFETTPKGRALLARSDSLIVKALTRHALPVLNHQPGELIREHKDTFTQDRVATLLRASLFEYALLTADVVEEECEEWLSRGSGSGTRMGFETATAAKSEAEVERERKIRYYATRAYVAYAQNAATAASARVQTWKKEVYKPYREHLRLLENLPEVRGMEGEMLLFEGWPKTFVKQIKIEEEDEGSGDEGSMDGEGWREGKRRRVA